MQLAGRGEPSAGHGPSPGAALLARLILWLPLGLVAVSGLVPAVLLLQLRGEVIQFGQRETQTVVRLAEDQATRTLQSVDETLQRINAQRTDLAGEAPAAAAERLNAALSASMAGRPFLRGLFVLDGRSRVMAAAPGNSVGEDLSDRAYDRYYLEHPQKEFELHPPVTSRRTGQRVIVATRPWRQADGTVAAVAAAVIDSAFFSRASGADVTGGSTTSLLRRDGLLLMRSPHGDSAIGSVDVAEALRTLPEAAAGTLRTASSADGVDRIVSYRTLSAYPEFLVVASQPVEQVLGAWYRHAALAAGAWLTGSVLLLSLSAWLRSEWRRRSRVEGELALARDRLSAVMDHTVDGLVVIDQAGTVLNFSRPAERLFGYAAAEVVGRNVNMLMPQPYRAGHDGYLDNYLRTGVAKVIGIGREVQGQRKDGSVFPLDLAIGEIPSVDGGRQFVGTVRDISHRKTTEEQLRQAYKMEAVGQLTGGIAHDFNNLLAVILGNVELARDGTPDRATADLLEMAQRAARRGAELTGRLLAFSRRQTLLPRRVDLNDLVRNVVSLLRRTLGEAVLLETELDDGPLYAEVDPGQLENALLNLAVNARDAMPNGGRLTIATASVALDADETGSHGEIGSGAYRVISVSDSGSGMPAAVKARVFEPFFTTKEVGKGSGLGLSMVYGFVMQSGGYINIASEPRQGTTVRLYLPAAGQEEDAAAPPAPPPSAVPIGQGRIALVAEDDPDVRGLVGELLRRMGFRTIMAGDGIEAVNYLASTEEIALMVTDVVMPKGMSGLDLATSAAASHPRIRVIYITGYSSETRSLAGVVRAGGTLLLKPFSRGQLAEAIRTAMGQAAQPPEPARSEAQPPSAPPA